MRGEGRRWAMRGGGEGEDAQNDLAVVSDRSIVTSSLDGWWVLVLVEPKKRLVSGKKSKVFNFANKTADRPVQADDSVLWIIELTFCSWNPRHVLPFNQQIK